MPKHIDTLHYITFGTPAQQIQQAQEACAAGARWIQLRIKNESQETILTTALAVKEICTHFNAVFILNDHLNVALKVDADGVHLGKEDSSPLEARKLLGADKIIGGTSNTLEDIEVLVAAGVDYIGLGPLRFTRTKEKLSPTLGLSGYQSILHHCRNKNIHTPIIAIGGIVQEDILPLLDTGVYGIAVSSVITASKDKSKTIASFYTTLNQACV
jgi:thiamine-phosphate pyrophosphorylase